jgi:hypothetical protein
MRVVEVDGFNNVEFSECAVAVPYTLSRRRVGLSRQYVRSAILSHHGRRNQFRIIVLRRIDPLAHRCRDHVGVGVLPEVTGTHLRVAQSATHRGPLWRESRACGV